MFILPFLFHLKPSVPVLQVEIGGKHLPSQIPAFVNSWKVAFAKQKNILPIFYCTCLENLYLYYLKEH